ncbi:hypothetical protein FHR92_002758 [Fontibacillus solani]|uniref:Uncharacterized protein n=2 Tax=Fontibacillus TaxID=995014 RepID=A0A1G7MPA3_9BACL|nr:hypothetical protein [Fontibacillus solani]SDF63668.1 hypothetical protein SAMN04488542_11445 [Fontibacillus panacisegetis]
MDDLKDVMFSIFILCLVVAAFAIMVFLLKRKGRNKGH